MPHHYTTPTFEFRVIRSVLSIAAIIVRILSIQGAHLERVNQYSFAHTNKYFSLKYLISLLLDVT